MEDSSELLLGAAQVFVFHSSRFSVPAAPQRTPGLRSPLITPKHHTSGHERGLG